MGPIAKAYQREILINLSRSRWFFLSHFQDDSTKAISIFFLKGLRKTFYEEFSERSQKGFFKVSKKDYLRIF